jgi:hypothetical protein
LLFLQFKKQPTEILPEASRKRPPEIWFSGILFWAILFVFEMTLFNETNLSLYHKSHSSFKEKDPPILTRFGNDREIFPLSFLTKKQEITDWKHELRVKSI